MARREIGKAKMNYLVTNWNITEKHTFSDFNEARDFALKEAARDGYLRNLRDVTIELECTVRPDGSFGKWHECSELSEKEKMWEAIDSLDD